MIHLLTSYIFLMNTFEYELQRTYIFTNANFEKLSLFILCLFSFSLLRKRDKLKPCLPDLLTE